MTRLFLATLSVVFFLPVAAIAQQQGAIDQSTMKHGAASNSDPVTEGGQAAFAAIAEIVTLLAADPATDWKSVNIEALRQHLIDMNNVTLRAEVVATATDTGVRFEAWSNDPLVQASIQRMVMAHVATMDGVNGWSPTAAKTDQGAILEVADAAAEVSMIQGLGFIGVMALGTHHQAHHLTLATGKDPHR